MNLLSFASGLKGVGGVLLAIVILLAMITIHEFGHYVAGKILGFKINEFAIGFGPALFKKRSKKTGELFSLRCIPLGGYCAFDGEDYDEEDERTNEEKEEETDGAELFEELSKKENDGGRVALNEENGEETVGCNNAKPAVENTERNVEEKDEKDEEEYPEPQGARFNDQAPWKRIIVLLAGATMNYLLALVLIIVMFASVGRPLYQVILNPYEETVTTTQTADSSEENSDEKSEGNEAIVGYMPLETGDILLKIDGHSVYMITDYVDALNGKKAGEEVDLVVLRKGEEMKLTMKLFEDANFKNMSAVQEMLSVMGFEKGEGLAPINVKQGFFQTIGSSFGYSVKVGGTVLRSLGELLTGKIGLDAMGGPVTTIQVTSQAAASGWGSFLNIASFIGVNLAVFNLLPIPALDGCKVIFCIIEWIRKKPVNRKVETIIHFIGIIALFGFAILVDVLQLFKGIF